MNPRPTLTSSDEEIVSFISSWIDHLIRDGYEIAVSQLDDSIQANRQKWTKNEWDQELECYGVAPSITPPVDVPDLRTDVYRYNDGTGFAVDYDLPVNGKRSDHTLQFDFRLIDGRIHVALDDLHVL